MPNFIEIEETFCGRTDGRTFETGFIRSTLKSRPKNCNVTNIVAFALSSIFSEMFDNIILEK